MIRFPGAFDNRRILRASSAVLGRGRPCVGKTIAKIVVGVLVVGVGLGYAVFKDDVAALWNKLHVKIAEYPQPKKTVWLDQGISKEKLSWFYHADQGTRTFGFPYEWFMALEQPTIRVADFQQGRRLQRDRLSRPLWLHPGHHHPGQEGASDRLRKGRSDAGPSGAPWKNPRTKETMNGIGLTCAGCSHRALHLQGHRAVVIDGGPALTRSLYDEAGHGRLLLLTRFIPTRFQPLRREYPGTGFHGRRPRGAEGPAQPGPAKQYGEVQALEERVARRASSKAMDGWTR